MRKRQISENSYIEAELNPVECTIWYHMDHMDNTVRAWLGLGLMRGPGCWLAQRSADRLN